MKKLDFLVIGAQKSGTTTVFKLLQQSPDVVVPTGKEAPFFSDDSEYLKGFERYSTTYFGNADKKLLWGTVTPHYLYDTLAPVRIFEHNPAIRLIAILRNPIERCESHFKMSVRRSIENRRFSAMVADELEPQALRRASKMRAGRESERNGYIVRGEYARQLKAYLDLFESEQLLILSADELERYPQNTLNRIMTHIGGEAFIPQGLGARYHKGGLKERLPLRKLARISVINYFWRKIPKRWRAPLAYWVHQHNVLSDNASLIDEISREALRRHYRKDIEELEILTTFRHPWHEFKASSLKKRSL